MKTQLHCAALTMVVGFGCSGKSTDARATPPSARTLDLAALGEVAATQDASTDEGGDAGSCALQQVQQSTLSPGAYPEVQASSPYSTSVTFNAMPNTLAFLVDMPTSITSPYVLGVDFTGMATICPTYDSSTGQWFAQVTLNLSWASDSGAVYNVYYGYQSYIVGYGAGGSVSAETLYEIDAEKDDVAKEDAGGPNDCTGASSAEHPTFARDVELTPQMYVGGEKDLAFQRGAYVPWTAVNTAQDMIDATNAAFTAKGDRVTVVLGSHGNVDWWRLSASAGLQANNATVQAYGAGVIGHVSQVYFESCCTAKGFSNGTRPNVIQSLSVAVTAGGQTYATVCGWNRYSYSWFRRGTFHVGHSNGDTLTCGTGP